MTIIQPDITKSIAAGMAAMRSLHASAVAREAEAAAKEQALRSASEALESKRAKVLDFTWAALYQGRPRPRGGTVFHEPTYYSEAELPKSGYRGAYGLGTISPIRDSAGQVQGLQFEIAATSDAGITLALAWFDPLLPAAAILVAFVTAGVVALALLSLRKTRMGSSIALGPYLLVGFAFSFIGQGWS